jgi:hypothetical protein
VIRLRYIDGQIHLRGQYALPGNTGTLFLSTWESFDPSTRLVTGGQFFELYNRDGEMQSKRFVEIRFYLHSQETFETLAHSQGFAVSAIYGDYARTGFDPEKSPFMIWVLRKQK